MRNTVPLLAAVVRVIVVDLRVANALAQDGGRNLRRVGRILVAERIAASSDASKIGC